MAVDVGRRHDGPIRSEEFSPAGFRQAAELMPHIVWMATPDQLIEYVNIQGTDYAGLPEEDLLGLKWLSVVHSDDVNRVQLAWETAARTQTSVGIECRFRRFDGQYRWHDVRSRPLLDDNGMIQKWIGTATDIEDAKRAEADLHRSKHEAEEALVLLETFQSNVTIGVC